MPTLPTPLDYGARPSLKSTRLDQPSYSGSDVGEALLRATEVFASHSAQKQAKEDKLNYALARNELISADIAERDKLKESEDWATMDESYSAGYATARDTVFGKYDLKESSYALLTSESDLILQSGRAQIGDLSRTVEIDEKLTRLNQQMIDAREALSVERDPELKRKLLLGILDAINAAEEEGYFGEDGDLKAQEKRELFTKDVVLSSLVNMDPKAREQVLERTLTKRNTDGPITVDDIRKGEGTDSIADFLHADTVKKLLKETRDENKITDDRGAAQAAVDAAQAKYPESPGKAMDEIRRLTKGDPDVRAVAEAMGRARNTEEAAAKLNMQNGLVTELSDAMEQYRWTYENLPEDKLAQLTTQQKALLHLVDERLQKKRQMFADVTNHHDEQRDDDGNLTKPAWSTWADMSLQEKVEEDLNLPMWRTNFTVGDWRKMLDEKELITSGKITQDIVQTNDQIQHTVLVSGLMGVQLPGTGRTPIQDAQWQRIRAAYADRVRDLQDEKYGGGKAPHGARKAELLLMLAEQGWQRDAGFGGLFWFDATDSEPMFSMTPTQMESGFTPISLIREQMTKIGIGEPAGEDGEYLESQKVEMTWEQRLKNRAAKELNGREPTEKDIENAYFAIRAGMSDAEVNRRLAGKGNE